MNPLISVIVPIYNVEKYLDKCVESIVNQTYKNLEIILVDDGSPDNCPRICDKWAEKDSRIKVIHKENGGAGSARNAGLDVSGGEYIGFVDGDDYIDNDFYEVLINKSKNGYYDVVTCGWKTIQRGNVSVEHKCYETETEFTSQQLLCEYFKSCKGEWVSFCNKIIKKILFKDLCFPENRLFEDWTLAPMVYFNAQNILFVPVYKYNYFIRQGSAVRTETIKRYVDCVCADYDHYCYFNNHNIGDYNEQIKAFIKIDFKKCIKTYSGRKDRTLLKQAYIECKSINKSFIIPFYYYFADVIRLVVKLIMK